MGHVGAELGGAADAEHGIQIRAVHVHLSTMIVNDLTDLAHRLFEHTVGGRVGNHQCPEGIGVLLRLRTQVGDIDIAVRVAVNDHHLHPRHLGAGGIRAVCR